MENGALQPEQNVSEQNKGHLDTFTELFINLGKKVNDTRVTLDFIGYQKRKLESELQKSQEYGKRCDNFIKDLGQQADQDSMRIKQLNLDNYNLKVANQKLEQTIERMRNGKVTRRK